MITVTTAGERSHGKIALSVKNYVLHPHERARSMLFEVRYTTNAASVNRHEDGKDVGSETGRGELSQ